MYIIALRMGNPIAVGEENTIFEVDILIVWFVCFLSPVDIQDFKAILITWLSIKLEYCSIILCKYASKSNMYDTITNCVLLGQSTPFVKKIIKFIGYDLGQVK